MTHVASEVLRKVEAADKSKDGHEPNPALPHPTPPDGTSELYNDLKNLWDLKRCFFY